MGIPPVAACRKRSKRKILIGEILAPCAFGSCTHVHRGIRRDTRCNMTNVFYENGGGLEQTRVGKPRCKCLCNRAKPIWPALQRQSQMNAVAHSMQTMIHFRRAGALPMSPSGIFYQGLRQSTRDHLAAHMSSYGHTENFKNLATTNQNRSSPGDWDRAGCQ